MYTARVWADGGCIGPHIPEPADRLLYGSYRALSSGGRVHHVRVPKLRDYGVRRTAPLAEWAIVPVALEGVAAWMMSLGFEPELIRTQADILLIQDSEYVHRCLTGEYRVNVNHLAVWAEVQEALALYRKVEYRRISGAEMKRILGH